MNKILIVFFAAIFTLVSADELETIANNVLSNIHSHLGGQGGQSSQYNFLSNGQFAKDAALELNKTRRDRLEEGVGSGGITFVSVTKGNKQVNVTTVYGVGAGAVLNIRDRQREAIDGEVQEVSDQEVNEITQPLYEKYVKELVEGEADKDAVVVHVGALEKGQLGLRDRRDELRVRGGAGFRVGARTTVSRRG